MRIFRNGVIAMSAPWVARTEAFKPHQAAFYRSPFFYSFLHVFAARWGVAATGGR